MAYKYAANVYHQLESIVDPIEVARFWITDKYNLLVANNAFDDKHIYLVDLGKED